MHIRSAGTATPADVFEALVDAVNGNMWNSAVSGATIVKVDIIKLDGVSATQTFLAPGTSAWTGQQSGDFAPQVAALVKFQTGLRGRDNRGRMFIPFTAEDVTLGGALSAISQGLMQTAWDAFDAALLADTTSPGPYDFVVAAYDRVHLGAGAHATDITNIVVEPQTATIRRRQTRNR
jgi:hypothetical protein